MQKNRVIRFIDLFAGIGGTRIGFTQALKTFGLEGECVFTSEIKPHAIKIYNDNFPKDKISGDITKIKTSEIPDFDILLGGFPCQPFSFAGARRGFLDTRGTLFFEIERILIDKKPDGFLLENVEGLVTHDKPNKNDSIGRTLETILKHLSDIGYVVEWKVLDSSKYGIPQKRKRIYILGTKKTKADLNNLPVIHSKLADILEDKVDKKYYISSDFVEKLLKNYKIESLNGKQIKDKRGGKNNIHSWDIELKGKVSADQKKLLEELLKQRRRKSWAKSKGIEWSDGIPLTIKEIMTFYKPSPDLFNQNFYEDESMEELKVMLDDLVSKGYLAYELPKKAPDWFKDFGYNIVAGKLSFEISHILNPDSFTPTLVATDAIKLAVCDTYGIRRLTIREGLRLFGFPEEYKMEDSIKYSEAFDLLGNSVSVGVIKIVSERLIKSIYS